MFPISKLNSVEVLQILSPNLGVVRCDLYQNGLSSFVKRFHNPALGGERGKTIDTNLFVLDSSN
jgi:hypothetical protein